MTLRLRYLYIALLGALCFDIVYGLTFSLATVNNDDFIQHDLSYFAGQIPFAFIVMSFPAALVGFVFANRIAHSTQGIKTFGIGVVVSLLTNMLTTLLWATLLNSHPFRAFETFLLENSVQTIMKSLLMSLFLFKYGFLLVAASGLSALALRSIIHRFGWLKTQS